MRHLVRGNIQAPIFHVGRYPDTRMGTKLRTRKPAPSEIDQASRRLLRGHASPTINTRAGMKRVTHGEWTSPTPTTWMGSISTQPHDSAIYRMMLMTFLAYNALLTGKCERSEYFSACSKLLCALLRLIFSLILLKLLLIVDVISVYVRMSFRIQIPPLSRI